MVGTNISHSSIEAYAKAFSAKITERFFASNKSINGQQLVNVTPVRQVNFLMLKNLFESWQNETKNIQSPYFDYKNEQVVKALVAFMNVLSQNIMIHRADFERLLTSSTQDCLYLMFAPFDFFWAELSQGEKANVTIKSIKAKAKYFKFNKHILEALVEEIEAKYDGTLSQEQALAVLEELIKSEEVTGEDYTSLVMQFSQVAALDINTMFEETEEDEAAEDEEAEDIFSQLLTAEEETAKPWQEDEPDDEPPFLENEKETSSGQPTEAVHYSFDEETTKAEEEESEVVSDKPDESKPKPAAPEAEQSEASGRQMLRRRKDVEEEEESEGVLNRKFNKEKPTINDQLQEPERKTIADVHGQSQSGKMHESVSVNQRYMFVNELFKGDPNAYNKAIDDIERCESFDDSVELMVQKYAKKLDWNMNSPEVKELLKIIFKRFR